MPASQKPTMAAAKRWLDSHVGQEIDTVQTNNNNAVWTPGIRTLTRDGGKYRLNGSQISLRGRVIREVSDSLLTVEWLDEAGYLIHRTTYIA